jgi:hypothetical protein
LSNASGTTKQRNFRLSVITVNRQRAANVQDNEQREWDRLKALNQRLAADAKPVTRI